MIKVGCCGFSTSMKRYFENFILVELNRTFYHYPREATVRGWREKAPKNFEFTVKAHQDISHTARLKVEKDSFEAFERMKQICRILGSKILLIQTPGSFKPDDLADAERFFRQVDRGSLALVWETRGPSWESHDAYKKLSRVLKELEVGHVADPFKVTPAYTGEIAYFRLHGLGENMYYYQYTDSELRRLKELVSVYDAGGKDIYVLFNNLSMFEDAVRFTKYLSNGTFPKITSSTGLASIEEVVAKTRYPVSKSVLIRKLGWRLVDSEEGKQAKLSTFLDDLPIKIYKNAEELLDGIKFARKLKD
jgi:uncharacterized protein YecE (DUF72 family)